MASLFGRLRLALDVGSRVASFSLRTSFTGMFSGALLQYVVTVISVFSSAFVKVLMKEDHRFDNMSRDVIRLPFTCWQKYRRYDR
jgi:hypothetical protein